MCFRNSGPIMVGMSTHTIVITKQVDGAATTRIFPSRREAAKFGVFYFLLDNGITAKREATHAAAQYQKSGHVMAYGYTFAELHA